MKARVFIGLKIASSLLPAILNWQKKNKHLPVRFIKPENLHLTLVPPWYVTDLAKLVEQFVLFKSEVKPFSFTFSQICVGPKPYQPRLIWATGQAVPWLILLKNELTAFFRQPQEKRAFFPHLTLARFSPASFKTIKFASEIINWQQEVKSVSLYQSFLQPGGAYYKIVGEIFLS